jgi:hypothetical protein
MQAVVKDESVTVTDGSHIVLYVSKDSRDAVAAANTLLVLLVDAVDDEETKYHIHRVARHLSSMLRGFNK